MSMNAQIRTDLKGNITVHMKGVLDYDNSTPFRQELESLIGKNPHSTITLDMDCVDFVGSSGIVHFVETLKILNGPKEQLRLSNVKPEFLRIFKLYNLNTLDRLIEKFDDDDTEILNQRGLHRRNTFQN